MTIRLRRPINSAQTVILFLILLAGLVMGTVGWMCDTFNIRPYWFEIAGFVVVIPTAIVLYRRDNG